MSEITIIQQVGDQWLRTILRNARLDVTPGEIEIGEVFGDWQAWIKNPDVIRSWDIAGKCTGYSIENVTLPPPKGRRYPHPGFSAFRRGIMENLRRCRKDYKDEVIP